MHFLQSCTFYYDPSRPVVCHRKVLPSLSVKNNSVPSISCTVLPWFSTVSLMSIQHFQDRPRGRMIIGVHCSQCCVVVLSVMLNTCAYHCNSPSSTYSRILCIPNSISEVLVTQNIPSGNTDLSQTLISAADSWLPMLMCMMLMCMPHSQPQVQL